MKNNNTNNNTNIDNIANEIIKGLTNYSEEKTKEVKEIIDDVANGCMDEIKKHITFKNRTKKYIKSFKVKTVKEDDYGKLKIWFASNGEYRLTHLLENGHVTRSGSRTKEYPHIKYGDEYVKRELPKRIEEVLKNGK